MAGESSRTEERSHYRGTGASALTVLEGGGEKLLTNVTTSKAWPRTPFIALAWPSAMPLGMLARSPSAARKGMTRRQRQPAASLMPCGAAESKRSCRGAGKNRAFNDVAGSMMSDGQRINCCSSCAASALLCDLPAASAIANPYGDCSRMATRSERCGAITRRAVTRGLKAKQRDPGVRGWEYEITPVSLLLQRCRRSRQMMGAGRSSRGVRMTKLRGPSSPRLYVARISICASVLR